MQITLLAMFIIFSSFPSLRLLRVIEYMTHRVVPYGLMVTKDSVAQSIYVKLRIQAKQNSNEKK